VRMPRLRIASGKQRRKSLSVDSLAVRPDRAVAVVTHDNRVFQFGDRIAHMDDGRIVDIEERAGAAA